VPFIHSWAAGTITVFLRRDCFAAGFFLLYSDRQVEVCGDSESLVRDPLARPDETPGPYVDFPMSVHTSRFFFWGGLVLAERSSPLPYNGIHSVSSYYCVNYA